MKIQWVKTCFMAIILLVAAMCIVLPVTAASGTVTISYRGSGGMNIGDSIFFDGTNTAGNITLIKITGPGLPPEGVPLYDLNGAPGTGNTVKVNPDGKWTFRWDSPKDSAKLQTAKYTIIASDSANPDKTASAAILLVKPEFYITIKPSSARMGDYVQIQGIADKSINYIKFNVMDASGTVYHTYLTPVSGTGSFEYSFYADMQPGKYTVTGSNPALKNNLEVGLTITGPQTTTLPSSSEQTAPTLTAMMTSTTQADTTPQTANTKTGIAQTTLILGVMISGAIAVLIQGKRNKD